ncbi:MAG: GNAT family N-acetyltransferase [Alphaproteobacteria bacterium]|nr:GNAT family N-acetyltransferase [Alphaproteobacteria bacterium]
MLFDAKINGSTVDLQLEFKAPNLPETEKDVKKARAFFALFKPNAPRLKLLYDFCGIKNVVQAKETMKEWLEQARNDESAPYYIYPKNTDKCVGCVRLKRLGTMIETGFWIAQSETGKGYMNAAAQAVEKMLFEKDITEIVRRVYKENPYFDIVQHNILKANYKPCSFKGVTFKPGDERIFETYHKTKEMYQNEVAGRLATIVSDKKVR